MANDIGKSISFRDVSHAFIHGNQAVIALWDVSLEVPPGQFLSLVGPSGCGKTTLLSMLAGLVSPTRGTVEIGDQRTVGASAGIAYMPARDALLPWRTARENVELGLIVRQVNKRERRERADAWLDKVGLYEFGDSRVSQLSQGMRQRVAIARTLVLEPACLLMDEPFAALDAQTRVSARAEFMRLWEEQQCTVVFVTHDLAEAVSLADRVVLLSRRPGRVVSDVTVDLPRPRATGLAGADREFHRYYDDLAEDLRRQNDLVESAVPGTAASVPPGATDSPEQAEVSHMVPGQLR